MLSETETARRQKEQQEAADRNDRLTKVAARAAWKSDDSSFEKAFPAILEQIRIAEVVSAVNGRKPIVTLD